MKKKNEIYDLINKVLSKPLKMRRVFWLHGAALPLAGQRCLYISEAYAGDLDPAVTVETTLN